MFVTNIGNHFTSPRYTYDVYAPCDCHVPTLDENIAALRNRNNLLAENIGKPAELVAEIAADMNPIVTYAETVSGYDMTSITGQKVSTTERTINFAAAGTKVGILTALVRWGRISAKVIDIITGITKKHGLFKCVECADEQMKALGKLGVQAKKVEIGVKNPRFPYIISNTLGGQSIATGGLHVGVEVDGIVFCNIHKNGLPRTEWLKDFDAAEGIIVLP